MAVDLVDGFSGGAVDLELKDVGVGFTSRRYCAAGMPHLLYGFYIASSWIVADATRRVPTGGRE